MRAKVSFHLSGRHARGPVFVLTSWIVEGTMDDELDLPPSPLFDTAHEVRSFPYHCVSSPFTFCFLSAEAQAVSESSRLAQKIRRIAGLRICTLDCTSLALHLLQITYFNALLPSPILLIGPEV